MTLTERDSSIVPEPSSVRSTESESSSTGSSPYGRFHFFARYDSAAILSASGGISLKSRISPYTCLPFPLASLYDMYCPMLFTVTPSQVNPISCQPPVRGVCVGSATSTPFVRNAKFTLLA